ncbi:MAG: cbb3-type cytochrome c oxidase subunit I [Acidimicrobiales bacterium]
MALTETRPETDAPEAAVAEATPAPVLERLLSTGDHKVIGRLWIGFGALFLLAGLVVGAVGAFEQADLGSFDIVDDGIEFVQAQSAVRDLIVLGGLIPLAIGVATMIVPLQVGASSIAFARGAAGAFWTWLFCTGVMAASYLMNGGPGGGVGDAVQLWTLTQIAVIAALVWGLICVATTVMGARATGMRFEWIPASSWGFFVYAIGGILMLPLVAAQLMLGYLDVRFGYLPTQESRLTLLGALDTLTHAPVVYWLALPVLGVAVDAIVTHTGVTLRFPKVVLGAIGVFGVLSMAAEVLVWNGRGRPIAFDNGLLVVATLAAVLPILATLALAGEALKRGKPAMRTPLVAGLLSGLLLLAAAAVALLGLVHPIVSFIETAGDTSIDLPDGFALAGTTFASGILGLVVAASVCGAVAAVNQWGHKIWGRQVDGRLGILAALVAALGGVVWAASMVASGFAGQGRDLSALSEAVDGAEAYNAAAGAGMALLAVSGVLLLVSVLLPSIGLGSQAEPFRGLTLEWLAPSPAPLSNFDAAPVVTSPYPALDATDDGGAQ